MFTAKFDKGNMPTYKSSKIALNIEIEVLFLGRIGKGM